MPEIIPNQDFKHEGKTYEKGKRYEVSDGEGYYFARSGWVGSGRVDNGPVMLEVHDGEHGHEAEVK